MLEHCSCMWQGQTCHRCPHGSRATALPFSNSSMHQYWQKPGRNFRVPLARHRQQDCLTRLAVPRQPVSSGAPFPLPDDNATTRVCRTPTHTSSVNRTVRRLRDLSGQSPDWPNTIKNGDSVAHGGLNPWPVCTSALQVASA